MLRSYDNGFPNLKQNFKTEKIDNVDKFQNNLNKISNFNKKTFNDLMVCEKLKTGEMDRLAKKHINFAKTSSNFRIVKSPLK